MVEEESIGWVLDMKGMVSMVTRWFVWRKIQKDITKEIAQKTKGTSA